MKNLIFIFMLLNSCILYSDNRIILYLNSKPIEIKNWLKNQIEHEKLKISKLNKINKKNPSNLSKKLLKNEYKKYLTPSLSGFLALYAGYVDYSNTNGKILFPKRHAPNKLYLIVTPTIKLIKAKENTISHKEFDEKEKDNTKIYLFEKKEDDNQQYFWRVTKQEMPESKIINPMSIVLLTKPKNIYINTGDFMANDSKHLILPQNMYVIKDENSKIILNFIKIKNFFEPIEIKEKKISNLLFQKILLSN